MNKKKIKTFLDKGLFYIQDGEKQILEGLNLMVAKASSSNLKKELQRHAKETESQIGRLEKVFDLLNTKPPQQSPSKLKKVAQKGKEIIKDITHLGNKVRPGVIRPLLEEGRALMEEFEGKPELLDFVICSGGEQIEQAEIATYTLLCHFAQQLEEDEVESLLQKTLAEEQWMLEALSRIHHQELKPQLNQGQKVCAVCP
jgi:ferritin-like metal-binding protein YciE